MALWLDHPKYVGVRDELILRLRAEHYRFRQLSPIIFLCGAAQSPQRVTLRQYLEKHYPTHSIFYADDVWLQIATTSVTSAMEMEAELADLSDIVIVIVESPGTCAEIGAFSLSEDLRKKVLPILDAKFEFEKSFIRTGPVQWIDKDSLFAPSLYVPLARILERADAIDERLARIPESSRAKVEDLSGSVKYLTFFVADLVALLEPVTLSILDYYLSAIVGTPVANLTTVVGLGVAMGLIGSTQLHAGETTETFYFRCGSEGLTRPFHRQKLLNLPSERARQLASLQNIDEAVRILEAYERRTTC